jgi:high affinity Mn2+ porin
MQWIFGPPILRLACGITLALLAHVTLAQEDQVAAREPVPPVEEKKAPPAGTEQIPEPKYFLPQLVGAQYTLTRQHLYRLTSPYSGTNSLTANGDTQSTNTYGFYIGVPLSKNLQAYVDVEEFQGSAVSNASGLGGLTNGDVVRQGASGLRKRPYIARKYLKYVLPLGEETEVLQRAQGQLPGSQPTRRLEFKAGVFAAIDDFDRNRYSNSTRTQFTNWSLWNNMAWDYAADTRGFSGGFYVGYITPQWALRASVMQMPSLANGQDLDAPLTKARGEQVELTLQPNQYGTVARFLVYRNIARMGNYRDAIALGIAQGTVPNVSANDRDGRERIGFGINLEQPLADDGDTGLFMRAGWNNGRVETFANTEVDRTLTLGGQVSGVRWKRPEDRLGIGFVFNGLSPAHKDYLAAGGSGFMLGDGALRYALEQIGEVYYRIQIGKYMQLSPQFQYIRNPGYNQDRGPARIAGIRLHLEY